MSDLNGGSTAPNGEGGIERRSSQALCDTKTSTPHSNRDGWDGKLRVEKKVVVKNADAAQNSDQEVESEDELPGEVIEADEDLLDQEDPDTEEIEAQHARIASIPHLRLERFPKLARLGLRQNLIQSLDGIPTTLAPTLKEVELYDNLIPHIRHLDPFVNLTSLDLSYNKIRHIKHLSHLKNLTHLYLVQNKISRIEGLEGLEKLQYLELGANRIRVIEGLETLTTLTQVWLGQNKISKLQGLSTLKNLRTLSIQANRIQSLDGLENLPQLEELFISDNLVDSLAPLSHNPNIEILDVQNNPIKSLQGVEGLTKLENLWASNCQLDRFDEVERALKDKEHLSEIYFEGNPLQKQNEVLYRNKVRLALPQVTKIDATYVRVTAYVRA